MEARTPHLYRSAGIIDTISHERHTPRFVAVRTYVVLVFIEDSVRCTEHLVTGFGGVVEVRGAQQRPSTTHHISRADQLMFEIRSTSATPTSFVHLAVRMKAWVAIG